MNRRSFLKGLVATAAGLMVPSGELADAEEVRRFWALDRTMTGPRPESIYHLNGQEYPTSPYIFGGIGVQPFEVYMVVDRAGLDPIGNRTDDKELVWIGPNREVVRGVGGTIPIAWKDNPSIHLAGVGLLEGI